MNTKQAKAEPLTDFLGRMGFLPVNVRGNDVWYRSPFRPDERTPSFKIDRVKNVWYDHGIGQGGTIIDFIGELHGAREIPRILATIADILGHAPQQPIIMPPVSYKPKESPIIESVGIISDRDLEDYLNSRAVPIDLARMYLKEIQYRVGAHGYRALGFGNDAGGFEVRNPSFKGTLGKKDITTFIKESSQSTAVFEGFFDFLSTLAMYQREEPTGNVVVLNSLALLDRGIERMNSFDTKSIIAYLDNDDAGKKALATLAERGTWEVKDASAMYQGAKDANEFVVKLRRHLIANRVGDGTPDDFTKAWKERDS